MYSRNRYFTEISALGIIRFVVSLVGAIGAIAAANDDDRFTAGLNFLTIAGCWVGEVYLSFKEFGLEMEDDSSRSSTGTCRGGGSTCARGSSSGRRGGKAARRTRGVASRRL